MKREFLSLSPTETQEQASEAAGDGEHHVIDGIVGTVRVIRAFSTTRPDHSAYHIRHHTTHNTRTEYGGSPKTVL